MSKYPDRSFLSPCNSRSHRSSCQSDPKGLASYAFPKCMVSWLRIQPCCLKSSDHSAALDGLVQSAVDILNIFEAGVSTRLTLQVIEQSGQ